MLSSIEAIERDSASISIVAGSGFFEHVRENMDTALSSAGVPRTGQGARPSRPYVAPTFEPDQASIEQEPEL